MVYLVSYWNGNPRRAHCAMVRAADATEARRVYMQTFGHAPTCTQVHVRVVPLEELDAWMGRGWPDVQVL